MKCIFFNVVVAQNTIVVVSLKLVLFPSQNGPCVQSVHQEEPRKNSKFVTASGFPNPEKRGWGLYILVRKVVAF
jgi:hypothetical protein